MFPLSYLLKSLLYDEKTEIETIVKISFQMITFIEYNQKVKIYLTGNLICNGCCGYFFSFLQYIINGYFT